MYNCDDGSFWDDIRENPTVYSIVAIAIACFATGAIIGKRVQIDSNGREDIILSALNRKAEATKGQYCPREGDALPFSEKQADSNATVSGYITLSRVAYGYASTGYYNRAIRGLTPELVVSGTSESGKPYRTRKFWPGSACFTNINAPQL